LKRKKVCYVKGNGIYLEKWIWLVKLWSLFQKHCFEVILPHV
jgi:hypothetical protein